MATLRDESPQWNIPFGYKIHVNMETLTTMTSERAMQLEDKYGAHNYHPLPVVLAKGQGVYLWDCEGKKYYDFLSAYSAVNQGHCHPRIIAALKEQAETLTLTSRAFFNDALGPYEKFIADYFGFDKVLPMNTGAEAVETAIKLCRKWAYEKKGIQENEAKIIVCENNFHGRTTTIVSFSNDPDARKNFGPYTPGFIKIPYDDIDALQIALQEDNVAGFLVEPIQGSLPTYECRKYLKFLSNYCKKNNLILIFDEMITGLRTNGSTLQKFFKINADISTFGKCFHKSSANTDISYSNIINITIKNKYLLKIIIICF